MPIHALPHYPSLSNKLFLLDRKWIAVYTTKGIAVH